nr:CcdB family protein [uncultured Duganella sp.]
MARFDIYGNTGKNRSKVPFLLDIQSNVISGLATRIVIPLRPLSLLPSVHLPTDIFPMIDIDDKQYFLDTPQLGAIPLAELKNKVGSARNRQAAIQGALDRVFGGY